MKRILEKLSKERQDKENEFARSLSQISQRLQAFSNTDALARLDDLISSLTELTPKKPRPSRRPSFSKKPPPDSPQDRFNSQLILLFQEFKSLVDTTLHETKSLISSLADIARTNNELMEARDREWDALGSNHVSMIFKSMEWRVDNLSARTEDANALMKRMLLLKEDLNRLLHTLEERDLPTPARVESVVNPLRDLIYTGFENRFRGSSDEVRKQQESYLSVFKTTDLDSPAKIVLDLGCGRGEFLELLQDAGIEAEGMDTNQEMIAVCKDKGLRCRNVDILTGLAEQEDGSLGGIFSSQVIEHLPPSDLKRLVELAYFKLAPGSPLILETLNPTSVFSLVQIFTLDLSHQKPIHPQTLRFLLESSGFDEVEIRYSSPLEEERLRNLPPENETAVILNQNMDKLNDLLFSPSNYAALGRKP